MKLISRPTTIWNDFTANYRYRKQQAEHDDLHAAIVEILSKQMPKHINNKLRMDKIQASADAIMERIKQ